MKKIIGRGVLLLETTPDEPGLKFGYQLSSAGIHFSLLGKDASLLTLSQAVNHRPLKGTTSVTGKGHLILNNLLSSPHDAFYNVSFEASKIGTDYESFSLQVTENGDFAHGPQSHFSGLDLTFKYNENKEIFISPSGVVNLHINDGVFSLGEAATIKLVPYWNDERGTLFFKASDTTSIQMDSIGKLNKLVIEVGSDYNRWTGIQGLYTFDGALTNGAFKNKEKKEFAAHDISGNGAPSFYFNGKDNFKEKNVDHYGASWSDKGISFESNSSILANKKGIPNPVVDCIKEAKAFSVEIWIKSKEAFQEGPAQIFSIIGKCGENCFSLGQGPIRKKGYHHIKATKGDFLNVNIQSEKKVHDWKNPFKSPPASLSEELMHVVFSCDQETQRLFINGDQIAERTVLVSFIDWLGNFRMGLGNDFEKQYFWNKKKPWKGEIHQLAIFNRAMSQEDVRQHYFPVIKITGDFSLDHMIPPLDGEVFPFELKIGKKESSLITEREVEFDINHRLAFKRILLKCTKQVGSPWTLSGKFLTSLWDDCVDLNAKLEKYDGAGSAHLQLTSPDNPPEPTNPNELGNAKYKDIFLRIGDRDGWELSFGEHQEFGVVPLVLENIMPGYQEFKLGSPHIVFAEPICMAGTWLEEKIEFVSKGTGNDRILTGSIKFDMGFSHVIPAPIHEASGIRIGKDIELVNTIMHIDLDLELQTEGFFARLNRNFDYEDLSGKKQNLKLAERRLYQVPLSKNALLEEILEEITFRLRSLFINDRQDYEVNYLDPNIPWPLLGFKDGKIPCHFLDQEIVLEKTGTDNYWILNEPDPKEFEFSMPFNYHLPALIDSETESIIRNEVKIDQGSMKIKISPEVHKTGIYSLVNPSFSYIDHKGDKKEKEIPQKELFLPPISKIALLGEVIEELHFLEDELFTDPGSHSKDYVIDISSGQPLIYLNDPVAPVKSVDCILPKLFKSDAQVSFNNTTDNTTFKLVQEANSKECTLTVPHPSVKIDANTLKNDYHKLLLQEGLSNTGINLLKRRVAEQLALNFEQVLYYNYGWNIDQGYLDLQAGMRLRIDLQNYQFVQVSDETASKGFVGSGSFYVPVNSYPFPQGAGKFIQKIGFGPFISRVQTSGQVEIHDTGAGGVLDVLRTGNRRAFYRLFYPKQPAIGPGSERVVTFLGADSYFELNEATKRFVNGDFTASDKVSSFFFRGKALIIPEIQVYVSDSPVFVAIGTTLRQLSEMYDDVPGAGPPQDLGIFSGKSRPLRRIHQGVNSEPAYRFINFPAHKGSEKNTDLLDLPLIKGDRFYF